VSGPLPIGVGTGATAYASPTLTDTTGTALSSDALTAVPWSIGSYDASDFYLFVEITGRGPLQFIEFAGTISELSVLPEPSTLALAAVAMLALARARRSH